MWNNPLPYVWKEIRRVIYILKVKEGIKLEELEKYGFEYKHGIISNRYDKGTIFVNCDNRYVYCFRDIDTLYDLITAGIVVKEW